LNKDLDEKIAQAQRYGQQRYTPTFEEYRRATPLQREKMTWPQAVINACRRQGDAA
jgi:hypothetical protein